MQKGFITPIFLIATTILLSIIAVSTPEIQNRFRTSLNLGDTNTFPATLNVIEDDDTIETSWANALEDKIGVDNSSVTTSLDYLIKNSASKLGSIANITPTNSVFIVADGSKFVGESGSTARTSLGLGTMALESNAGTTTIDTVGTLTTAGGNISLWTNDSGYITSLTPWTSNIDGGGYNLINVDYINATGTSATSTFTAVSIGTTTSCCKLCVDGSIHTTDTFYGNTWSSYDGNSMYIKPSGDEDNYLSFKTVANRPTIKVEGGKFMYMDSSNVYDMGISLRADDTYSGTLNYEKDGHMMTVLGKNSPLGFKANSDYDDYIKIQTASNTPEMTVASSTAFKINAGGSNNLLLNHSGGNVAIGTTTATYTLSLETGKTLGIGTTQWNSGDEIDGTKIKDADYGDISVSAGGAWSIDSGLNLTFGNVTTTNLTVTNAFNLNGTVGSSIDMSNELILNIGNAGTDFIAGGGLTLAGTLTANGAFTANSTSTFAGLTTSANIVMGDNSITGIDTLTFTDTAGTIAGIANGNLLSKIDTEAISGIYNHSKAVNISIADGGNDVGLTVTNLDVTNNPRGVQFTNAGTSAGLYLDQNGEGQALQVDSIATTKPGIYSVGSGIYTGSGCNSFSSFWLTNAGSTGNLASFQNAGTGYATFINQDGEGIALYVDSEATTKMSFYVDGQNAGTNEGLSNSYAFSVTNNGQGGVGNYYRNQATTTVPMVMINEDNISASEEVLKIKNDGAGDTAFLSTTGTGKDLNIVGSASTTVYIGDSTHSGCIVMGDSDNGGLTYLTALNGVLTATSTKPAICK